MEDPIINIDHSNSMVYIYEGWKLYDPCTCTDNFPKYSIPTSEFVGIVTGEDKIIELGGYEYSLKDIVMNRKYHRYVRVNS